MASIMGIAKAFFAASDPSKGWEACKKYCRPNAIFVATLNPRLDNPGTGGY